MHYIFLIFDLRNFVFALQCYVLYFSNEFIFSNVLQLTIPVFRFQNKIFHFYASVNTNGSQYRSYSAIIFIDNIFLLSLYCYKSIGCVLVSFCILTQRHVQQGRCTRALASINVACKGNLSKSSDEHARVVAINFKCIAQNVKCP